MSLSFVPLHIRVLSEKGGNNVKKQSLVSWYWNIFLLFENKILGSVYIFFYFLIHNNYFCLIKFLVLNQYNLSCIRDIKNIFMSLVVLTFQFSFHALWIHTFVKKMSGTCPSEQMHTLVSMPPKIRVFLNSWGTEND